MVQQLPLEQKVGTGNTGTGTSTGKNNGNTGAATGNTGAATGNTGSTTLTIDQIPSHSHSVTTWNYYSMTPATGTKIPKTYDSADGNATKTNTNSTGGGKGHTHTLNSHTHTLNSHTHTLNNHQHTIPYIECYVWKRTA